MGEFTAISWADHTFNPWLGCTKVSPACDGCYAEALMDKRLGKVQWGPHGERVRTSASNWQQPLKWDRAAAKAGTRPFVFCASLADVFDNRVPPAWRNDLIDLIRATPNLVWLLLTKRPQNILPMIQKTAWGFLPRNAALGTTVEDQARAVINIPALCSATYNLAPIFSFLSCEPLLGPLHITSMETRRFLHAPPELLRHTHFNPLAPGAPWAIGWIISGGETDQGAHKARPSHPAWFRDLRDQADFNRVPYQHKQNGEWVSVSEVEGDGPHFRFPDGATVRRVGKAHSGRLLDGVLHDARPVIDRAVREAAA